MLKSHVGACLLGLLLLAGCGTNVATPAAKAFASAGAPPTVRNGCAWHLPAASIGDRSQLPDDATSATLVWDTGFGLPSPTGQHRCRRYESHMNGPGARRLVAAIKALPPPPSGIVHCPIDFGDFVQVWFVTTANYVSFRIKLGGCRFDEPSPADLGTWPPALRLQS